MVLSPGRALPSPGELLKIPVPGTNYIIHVGGWDLGISSVENLPGSSDVYPRPRSPALFHL